MTQKICTDDSVLDFLYKILQSSLFMKTENDVIGVVEDFYESMKLSKSVITEIDYILKTAGLIRDTSGFIENEISGEISLKIFKSLQYSSRVVNGARNLITSIIQREQIIKTIALLTDKEHEHRLMLEEELKYLQAFIKNRLHAQNLLTEKLKGENIEN